MAKRKAKPAGTGSIYKEIAQAISDGRASAPSQPQVDVSGMRGGSLSSSGPMGEPPLQTGPYIDAEQRASRWATGADANNLKLLLEKAGVDNPKTLQKIAAKLVNASGVGEGIVTGIPGSGAYGLGRPAKAVAGWVGKQAVHSPVGTALTALAALQMLAPGMVDKITSPVKDATGGDSAVDLFLNKTGLLPWQPTFANRLANQGQLTVLQDQMRLKAQRDAQTAAQNTALLFQTAPHVAAQIMAGRRLPKGAVVIGGTPRVDLMQEMAMQMGQGQFEQQDPMHQILERQQGGVA